MSQMCSSVLLRCLWAQIANFHIGPATALSCLTAIIRGWTTSRFCQCHWRISNYFLCICVFTSPARHISTIEVWRRASTEYMQLFKLLSKTAGEDGGGPPSGLQKKFYKKREKFTTGSQLKSAKSSLVCCFPFTWVQAVMNLENA